MTFERQKKFPFISSKFQTPADKVIKVSAGGTEGAQYLGRRRGKGKGGVLGRVLSAFYQIPPPTNPALSITGLGGFMPVITKLFEEFLSGSDCAACLSQMCHCTPLISFHLYFHVYLYLYLYPYLYPYLYQYFYLCGNTPCLSQMCHCTPSPHVFSAHFCARF